MREKLSIVFIIFILSLLLIMKLSTTNISKVVDDNLDEITNISFRNGSNGELIETDDKNKIKEIISYLKALVLKRKYFNRDSTGYSYYADFYVDNKKIFTITFAGEVDISGTKYKVIYNKKKNNYLNEFVENLK